MNSTIQKQEVSPVLFDEDYRAHIAKLDAMLARERAEVWELRARLAEAKRAVKFRIE